MIAKPGRWPGAKQSLRPERKGEVEAHRANGCDEETLGKRMKGGPERST